MNYKYLNKALAATGVALNIDSLKIVIPPMIINQRKTIPTVIVYKKIMTPIKNVIT